MSDANGKQKQRFAMVPAAVIDAADEIGLQAIGLYAVLASYPYANERDVYPSQAELAEHCGLSEKPIRRLLDKLQSAGFISCRRTGTGCRYRLLGRTGEISRSETASEREKPPDRKQQANGRHLPIETGETSRSKREKTPDRGQDGALLEKSKKKERGNNGVRIPIPESLNTPDFRSTWTEWLAYRRERRLTMTERTLNTQLKKLEAVGPVDAVAMIEDSIGHGWQSVGYASQRNGNHELSPAQQREQRTLQAMKDFASE